MSPNNRMEQSFVICPHIGMPYSVEKEQITFPDREDAHKHSRAKKADMTESYFAHT